MQQLFSLSGIGDQHLLWQGSATFLAERVISLTFFAYFLTNAAIKRATSGSRAIACRPLFYGFPDQSMQCKTATPYTMMQHVEQTEEPKQ